MVTLPLQVRALVLAGGRDFAGSPTRYPWFSPLEFDALFNHYGLNHSTFPVQSSLDLTGTPMLPPDLADPPQHSSLMTCLRTAIRTSFLTSIPVGEPLCSQYFERTMKIGVFNYALSNCN